MAIPDASAENPVLEMLPLQVLEPAAGEVLLQVDVAGLCHSDLHILDGLLGRGGKGKPFALSHEIGGTVRAVGELRTRQRPPSQTPAAPAAPAAPAPPHRQHYHQHYHQQHHCCHHNQHQRTAASGPVSA